MKYAPIEEVISVAQTVVKASDNTDRNIWKQWVYLATLELGISDDEIKVCTLFPKDFVAKLPSDCRQIIEISLFDGNGQRLLHKFRSGKVRIYPDGMQNVTTNTDGVEQFFPVDVSNDSYNLFLGSNGANVTQIALRYFAYPVDANNMPMVRDEDIMACVYYIRYMQALRDDDNRSKIEQDRMAWFMESDRAKARKKMESMTPDKSRSLMKSMMSLVTPFRQIQNF